MSQVQMCVIKTYKTSFSIKRSTINGQVELHKSGLLPEDCTFPVSAVLGVQDASSGLITYFPIGIIPSSWQQSGASTYSMYMDITPGLRFDNRVIGTGTNTYDDKPTRWLLDILFENDAISGSSSTMDFRAYLAIFYY